MDMRKDEENAGRKNKRSKHFCSDGFFTFHCLNGIVVDRICNGFVT